MQNPWLIRLMIAGFFLTLVKLSPFLTWCVVIAGIGYAAYQIRLHLIRKAALQKSPSGANTKPTSLIIVQNYDPASGLADYLQESVYGQPLAAEQVSKVIWNRLKAGLNEKPIGVFCFVGPPGVGKSQFAKVLNKRLFDREDTLLNIDMAGYGDPYTIGDLLGGHDREGILPTYLLEHPNCIVLLDEFDKSHKDVHKRFLTAFHDGFITNTSKGIKIPTTQAIFILTMNSGADRMVELLSMNRPASINSGARSILSSYLAPELVDRIDAIVPFAPLIPRDLGKVVYNELCSLAGKLGVPVVDGGVDVQILVEIVANSLEQGNSVRDIKRNLELQFISGLELAKRQGATSVMIRDEGGQVVVEPC